MIQNNETDKGREQNNDLVFSYLTLRNLIGLCGFLLPIALSICPDRPGTHFGFEPSISDYYYTSRGDLLVVILSVLGVFLFTYYGYNWKERALTLIAAIAGLGVAFIPTQMRCEACAYSIHTGDNILSHMLGEGMHLSCAALFLLSLALMSLIYFPKSKEKEHKKENGNMTQKGKRNIVYKVCGWIMICCVGVLAVYFILKKNGMANIGDFPIIFTFETIAVWAFALSWLTKGETFWPDGEHYVLRLFRKK